MNNCLVLTVRKSLEWNFTAIYRWAFIGEVASAIESIGLWQVDIFDGALSDAHLDDYCNLVKKKKYDLILFYTDPHTSKHVKIISEYIKVLSPDTKILVYGRATIFMPQYFCRFPFDAVHIGGDRELVIKDYAQYLSGKLSIDCLHGLITIGDNNAILKHAIGKRYETNSWFSPALKVLPIEKYKKYYKTKNKVFEYAISVSKGCALNCQYCETSQDQGVVDRRRDHVEVVDWINRIEDSEDWIVQLWSSNLFHDSGWLARFSEYYQRTKSTFKWRGVGCVSDLTPSLVKLASESGCQEIAVGVETIFAKQKRLLKSSMDSFVSAIKLCKDAKINLKCLLMIGIPGQSFDDFIFTIRFLRENNLDFRVSSCTPLQELTDLSVSELDNMDLTIYDRRVYPCDWIDFNIQVLALNGVWQKLLEKNQ